MDGIIVVNKPKGCTSHDVVYKIKKICHEKVGHTGTLDPMATGVLPLLIGKGTLCSKYLINHDKEYQVTLQLGIKTDSADSEGNIIEEKEVQEESLKQENLEKVLQSFLGKQEQIPPMYSAIKVKGKKLYEYARKGQTIKVEPRTIEIYQIELTNSNKEKKQIEFKVACSKGTYMRSLCEDIATKLSTVGYMAGLNRLQVGDFKLEDAITMTELEQKEQEEQKEKFLQEKIITIEKLFENYPKIALELEKRIPFLNGVKLTNNQDDGVYRIYDNEKFIGIGVLENHQLKRDIIL